MDLDSVHPLLPSLPYMLFNTHLFAKQEKVGHFCVHCNSFLYLTEKNSMTCIVHKNISKKKIRQIEADRLLSIFNMFQGRNLVTARSESLMSWGSATCSKLPWPAITHTPTEVLTDYVKFCFSTINQYYLTPFTFQQGKCVFNLKIQLRVFFCHICSFANIPLALIHIQRQLSAIERQTGL